MPKREDIKNLNSEDVSNLVRLICLKKVKELIIFFCINTHPIQNKTGLYLGT